MGAAAAGEIRAATVAIASRKPRPAVCATPSSSKWVSRLLMASMAKTAAIGRLRQLPPAKISRSTTAQNATGKARSSTAAAQGPISADRPTAARPRAQSPTSSAKPGPRSGSRPVQLGIAVSRKPAITAATKPNSISWACQVAGSKAVGRATTPTRPPSQSATARADHIPAARKNGRNPTRRISGPT